MTNQEARDDEPKVRIFVNSNTHMSRGKYAAAAVHAALTAAGVHPCLPVIVLGAQRDHVERMRTVIRDAGKTEVEPGTPTAGTDWTPATDQEARDEREALDEAARTIGDYADLDRAIAGVLFNVSNFPEAVQARMLGQNTRPLTEKLVDAVLAAGYRKHPEPESNPRCEHGIALSDLCEHVSRLTNSEHPEPEWEYGIRPEDDEVPLGVSPMPTLGAAQVRANNIRGGWVIVRRTKPGPWEPVPTPAEGNEP